MKKTFFILSGLLVMLACQKTQVAGDAGNGETPIAFSVPTIDVEMGSKADVTTENLSSIYVTATGTSAGFTNTTFTKNGDSFYGSKYWPNSDPSYKFQACNIQMTDATIVVTTGNVTTDIVWEYLASPTYKSTNALSMKHLLAKMGSFNNTGATDGYTLTVNSFTVSPYKSGTFAMTTETWSSQGDASACAGGTIASGASDSTYDGLMVVPGTYSLTVKFKLTKGDYDSGELTKTGDIVLTAGATNNFNIKASGTGASEITFTVSVVGWTSSTADFNLN